MNDHQPKVSIILITFNRAEALPRSIESVLTQSYRNIELLLINNGCTDHSAAVVEKYLHDKRVRSFTIPENRGFIGGFNFALEHLEGEWFCCIGDDDTITQNAIERMVYVGMSDSELKAVNCNSSSIESDKLYGKGLKLSQYVSPSQYVGKMTGMFWGITKTDLIGNTKLPEGTPNDEAIFWYRISGDVKRYYIHEALYCLNKTNTDTLSNALDIPDIDVKVCLYENLIKEFDYLDVLQKYNPEKYLARCIRGFIFMKIAGINDARELYRSRLRKTRMNIGYLLFSNFVFLSHRSFLKNLYLRLGNIQKARLIYYPILRRYSEIAG